MQSLHGYLVPCEGPTSAPTASLTPPPTEGTSAPTASPTPPPTEGTLAPTASLTPPPTSGKRCYEPEWHKVCQDPSPGLLKEVEVGGVEVCQDVCDITPGCVAYDFYSEASRRQIRSTCRVFSSNECTFKSYAFMQSLHGYLVPCEGPTSTPTASLTPPPTEGSSAPTASLTPLVTQDCSFVEELYLRILCRPGKAHGIQFYRGKCAEGVDQSHMERIFRNSDEYQACAKCKNNCSTTAPTESPTQAPTTSPTPAPTRSPTQAPTRSPTQAPSGKRCYAHEFDKVCKDPVPGLLKEVETD